LFEVIAPSNVVTRLVTAVLQESMLLVALRAAHVQYQVLIRIFRHLIVNVETIFGDLVPKGDLPRMLVVVELSLDNSTL
jgi:hypothetical protein